MSENENEKAVGRMKPLQIVPATMPSWHEIDRAMLVLIRACARDWGSMPEEGLKSEAELEQLAVEFNYRYRGFLEWVKPLFRRLSK